MQDGSGAGHVAILMGVYNGAIDLPAQLDSFAAQTYGDWSLLASDDGSEDDSAAVLARFAEAQAGAGRQVTVRPGPRRGFVANFLSMLVDPPDADWIALADQDDVWLPERLERGLAALAPLPRDRPALYCSATWIVDGALEGHRPSPTFRRAPGFRNALVQNIASGNTILLNRAGVDLARATAPAAARVADLPAHDWWLYQIVTGAGGTVIRDPEPTILYRQHGTNLIGANDSMPARVRRIAMVLDGRFGRWNAANLAALLPVRRRFTPQNCASLDAFATLSSLPLHRRIPAFLRLGLYRQTAYGQTALWVALLLGRL